MGENEAAWPFSILRQAVLLGDCPPLTGLLIHNEVMEAGEPREEILAG